MRQLPALAMLFALPTIAFCARVEVGQAGVTLSVDDASAPLVRGMRYEAVDDQGIVFKTAGASLSQDGTVSFELEGPGAGEASVTARMTRSQHGCTLKWRITYTGPERKWNPWSSCFRYDFGAKITGAWTRPVTKWVKPTGEHPWEVPGDTLYPDTECQLRTVLFGDTALAMVSSSYDPDWIYNRNLERVTFARFGLPAETPCEREITVSYLALRADQARDADLAAEAAGRPIALELTTGRTGNVFAPGEDVGVGCRLRNVTAEPQDFELTVAAHDYYGTKLLARERKGRLEADEGLTIDHALKPQSRGIIFLDATVRWDGGEKTTRTTIGILPERSGGQVRPGSRFGMAAIIANPQHYPDHLPMPTVLAQMERIGVRWIRGGWFPLKADISAQDEETVRERVDLLSAHGILPHVQLGGQVPEPDQLDEFRAKLTASLERFKWVSPYVEVGNELNFATEAPDYVTKMLRPVSETMRQVFPEGKVMSMGLGGVTQKWLDEFTASGGMDLIDVLSVHPGCHPRSPEFWEGWRGWVFRPQMLDAAKAAREHGEREVWITEAYSPTSPGRSQVDLRTSADYLVRTYACAIGLGVRVTEWYQFQDGVWFGQRERPDDIEYNFGIVYTDLSPKPAYVAYGVMTEMLERARYQGRLDLGGDDLYGMRLIRDGATVDLLWSCREKHETDLAWYPPENHKDDSRKPGEPWEERWHEPVTVQLPAAGPVEVTDIMGNTRTLAPENGKVSLPITGSPIYVQGLGDIPRLPRFWQDIP